MVFISLNIIVFEVINGMQYFFTNMQHSVIVIYLSQYSTFKFNDIHFQYLNNYALFQNIKQHQGLFYNMVGEIVIQYQIKSNMSLDNGLVIKYINKQQEYQQIRKMKQYKKFEPQFFSVNSKNLESNEDHLPYNHYTNTKNSSGSLSKYNKSPYLQKFSQGFTLPKKISNANSSGQQPKNSRIRQIEAYDSSEFKQSQGDQKQNSLFKKMDYQSGYASKKQTQRSKSNMSMSTEQRDKGIKFKLPKLDMQYIKTDKKQKISNNTLSATLEVTTKKKKLIPIPHSFKSQAIFKTKAGTNGNQTKINQDIAIIQTALPHGVRLYCVCDGHGLNGHLVSAYIKQSLIKNLTTLLKKHATEPPNISQIFEYSLALTNDGLLNSDINTQLSGSTVIAVFIYKDTIYSFNIGDSRAILVTEQSNENFKVVPLSDDHKPSRQDEKQRILKFGGRVQAQKNERGQLLGPLRVWMKQVQMPGLAMTRSFGDKAGIKAGTHAEPELKVHKIEPSDKYIVIASDGVWQYLQNDQVMNIINPFYKKNDIDMAAEKIMRISTQIWHKISYSRDDITIIIVSLNAPNNQKKDKENNSGQSRNNAKYTEIHE